jgi:hypothetical protein
MGSNDVLKPNEARFWKTEILCRLLRRSIVSVSEQYDHRKLFSTSRAFSTRRTGAGSVFRINPGAQLFVASCFIWFPLYQKHCFCFVCIDVTPLRGISTMVDVPQRNVVCDPRRDGGEVLRIEHLGRSHRDATFTQVAASLNALTDGLPL